MAAVRFDTLDYARKLEGAGVPRDQAALQAKALGDELGGKIATLQWMFGAMFALNGTALVQLLFRH